MPDRDVVLAKAAAIQRSLNLKDLEDFYTAVLVHFKMAKQ